MGGYAYAPGNVCRNYREPSRNSAPDSMHTRANSPQKMGREWLPQEAQGEEIPLSGRIITIADVFDALTIDRPSKRHGL